MPHTQTNYEEKPYNRCIDCKHIGVRCDGPNFLTMPIPRLCEWARLRKSYLLTYDKKWTNAYIAENALLSKTTVDRFLAGDLDDIRMSTASAIICALVNVSRGQYPCAMSDADELGEECERYRELLEEEKKKTEHLKRQVEFQEKQIVTKDEQIADRKRFLLLKDRTIQILAVLLGISVCIIVGSLVVDFINPTYGYFWTK